MMEILNAQKFNESINIQPMTRKRMEGLASTTSKSYENGLLGKIVKIGGMWWTAENLSIIPNSDYKMGTHYYVEETDKEVRVFYHFDTALHIVPNGWHLPTSEEVLKLFDAFGYESSIWTSKDEKFGTDAYGLCERYLGCYYCGMPYNTEKQFGFWLGGKRFGTGVYERAEAVIGYLGKNVGIESTTTVAHAYPIRLIKD